MRENCLPGRKLVVPVCNYIFNFSGIEKTERTKNQFEGINFSFLYVFISRFILKKNEEEKKEVGLKLHSSRLFEQIRFENVIDGAWYNSFLLSSSLLSVLVRGHLFFFYLCFFFCEKNIERIKYLIGSKMIFHVLFSFVTNIISIESDKSWFPTFEYIVIFSPKCVKFNRIHVRKFLFQIEYFSLFTR